VSLMAAASCSHPQTSVESAQDTWRRMFCQAYENDYRCESRLNQQAGINENETTELWRQRQAAKSSYPEDADDRYCRTQAQIAMAAADHGGLVYGGVMAMAYGNQTYRICKGYQ
jgi:hypothetical protein